jgi:hypothetical protein
MEKEQQRSSISRGAGVVERGGSPLVQSRFAARLARSQIEALLGRRIFPETGSDRTTR